MWAVEEESGPASAPEDRRANLKRHISDRPHPLGRAASLAALVTSCREQGVGAATNRPNLLWMSVEVLIAAACSSQRHGLPEGEVGSIQEQESKGNAGHKQCAYIPCSRFCA